MAIENFKQMADELMCLTGEIARKDTRAISLLTKVYTELFNQTIIQGCGSCYQKAFYRIQKYFYLNKISEMNSEKYSGRKFLLKPGRQLQTEFGGDALTNDNMMDEAAEKLLKKHPSLVKHFDRYPDGFFDNQTPDNDTQDNDETEKIIHDNTEHHEDAILSDDEAKAFFSSLNKKDSNSFLKNANADIDQNKTDLIVVVDGVEKSITIDQLKAIVAENTPLA